MTCPYGVSGNHTVNGRSWGFNVSDPRSWWYIPESGIYHQSKLTRKERPGPQSAGGKRRQHRPGLTGPGA